MIITKSAIKQKCNVVKKLNNERFYIKKDEKYLTICENRNNTIWLVLEISLNEEDVCISPNELWGIIKKRTYGEKIYIEESELIKFQESSKLPKTIEKEKSTNIEHDKVIDIEWKRVNSIRCKNSTAKEG